MAALHWSTPALGSAAPRSSTESQRQAWKLPLTQANRITNGTSLQHPAASRSAGCRLILRRSAAHRRLLPPETRMDTCTSGLVDKRSKHWLPAVNRIPCHGDYCQWAAAGRRTLTIHRCERSDGGTTRCLGPSFSPLCPHVPPPSYSLLPSRHLITLQLSQWLAALGRHGSGRAAFVDLQNRPAC